MTDNEFLEAFEATTLPRQLWTHAAHVRMGYLMFQKYGSTEAPTHISTGIRRYNEAKGNPTGYHETITAAFCRLIASRFDSASTWDLFQATHPDLLQPGVLERYYTRELLFSPEARAGFVDPNVEPLP
ncbi:MAG: hypothetical protein QM758_01630 [Armatimonas sp.]